MRLLCLISSLVCGGAERQMVSLASALRRRGADVTLLTYRPGDFFKPELEAEGVRHIQLRVTGYPRILLGIRRVIREVQPDVVLAFMNHCAFYAELAGLPRRRWGLVASERGTDAETTPMWRRRLHCLADCVITNSHSNRLRLEHSVPKLRGRVATIYNMVDLNKYCPSPKRDPEGGAVRFLTLARYHPVKNACGLVQGLAEARTRDPGSKARLDWYGDLEACAPDQRGMTEVDRARAMAERHGVADRVGLHGPTKDTVLAYRNADAVILPSFFEGLPNTICEALACGCPVLQSDVCDAGNLVKEGGNGFLFDPASSRSIASALLRFAALTPVQRLGFGAASRRMAERMFCEKTVVDAYERVLSDAAARRPVQPQHWVPEVPESSVRTAALKTSEIPGL